MAIFVIPNQLLKSNSVLELTKGCLGPWAARHIFSDYPQVVQGSIGSSLISLAGAWKKPVSLKIITPCHQAMCEKEVQNMPVSLGWPLLTWFHRTRASKLPNFSLSFSLLYRLLVSSGGMQASGDWWERCHPKLGGTSWFVVSVSSSRASPSYLKYPTVS